MAVRVYLISEQLSMGSFFIRTLPGQIVPCLWASLISTGTVGAPAPMGVPLSIWLPVRNTDCKINLCCLLRKSSRGSDLTLLCQTTPLDQSAPISIYLRWSREGVDVQRVGWNTPVMPLWVTAGFFFSPTFCPRARHSCSVVPIFWCY